MANLPVDFYLGYYLIVHFSLNINECLLCREMKETLLQGAFGRVARDKCS